MHLHRELVLGRVIKKDNNYFVMNDNQENNERDKSKLSSMPKSIHYFNFIYLLFCVSLIAFGVKLISVPEKITTFSCERTPKHINCQLANRDWSESSVKIYSELDLWMGVEVKAIHDGGENRYYVGVLSIPPQLMFVTIAGHTPIKFLKG